MKQIKIAYGEDEANKTVREIMQRQGKIIAMRPFRNINASDEVAIAIEYEEN